jgi:uncharacterized membrane protein
MSNSVNHRLWQLTFLLLFAAGLRIQHVVSFVEWPDEISTLWRSQGSLNRLLVLTPEDWPPLYGIIHWVWVQFVGPTLEATRYLSVLAALPGLAVTYRAARALFQTTSPENPRAHPAALLAAAFYATLAYPIYAGVDARAYGLLLALAALSMWLTLRWLRCPTWQRAAGPAISIAALFATSYTSAAFVPVMSLLVILLRPRLILRWMGIGVAALALSLPVLPRFYNNATTRVSNPMNQSIPPFAEAMQTIFRNLGGPEWFVWLVIALGIVAVAQAIRQPRKPQVLLMFGVWIASPVAVYYLLDSREFLNPRYMWWVATGIALLAGLIVLPLARAPQWIAIGATLLLPLIPVDYSNYRSSKSASTPFRAVFSWYAERLRPGDVLILDPNCACGKEEGWDYFVPMYFHNHHLPVVAAPGDAARVWYLATLGSEEPALLAEIEADRIQSDTVGPWYFHLRLYEGPPSWTGVTFGDKITFHGLEILDTGTVVVRSVSFQRQLSAQVH